MIYPQDDKKWTAYSAIIILFFLFLQIQHLPLLPTFLDIYHHLAVAQGFDKAGGFVTHAFWEYAPLGRPHLYPPLFHFLILPFIKAGLSPLFIARLLEAITFPIFTAVICFFMSSLFNRRAAFFSVLILVSLYSLYLSVSIFIPLTLSLIFGLLSFWAEEKDRIMASSIFLALSFYSHVQFPWVITIAFLIYAIMVRERAVKCLKVVSMGIILALPIIAHLLRNIYFYHLRLAPEKFILEINLALLVSIFGMKAVFLKKKRHYYPLALILTAIPLAFLYPYRYMSGQGVVGIVFMGAIAMDWLCERRGKKINIIIILILSIFILASPAIIIMPDKRVEFEAVNCTYANLISAHKRIGRPNERSIYSKFIGELVDIVRQHSGANDIIFVNMPFVGTVVAALSERSNLGGMVTEIAPSSTKADIQNAKLIIWLKDTDGKVGPMLPETLAGYGLKKIAETEMAYVYENTSGEAKIRIEKAALTNNIILAIFIITVFLLIWGLRPATGRNVINFQKTP